MSARDELAKDIDHVLFTDSFYGDMFRDGHSRKTLIDVILTAGYTKPRTITTEEELDALPKDCIVLDRYGVANQLSVERVTDGPLERLWNTTGLDCNASVALPATVLYEPEA